MINRFFSRVTPLYRCLTDFIKTIECTFVKFPVPPQNFPLLYYFDISIFGWQTLELFLRRLWRQYINFEGGSARRKRRSFSDKY